MACVFGAVILLCLVSFRSASATLAILLPLGLVSLLCYALMALLDIGLKVSTLPVAALGVGIGVDYGIYLYGRLAAFRAAGCALREAYFRTLEVTGSGVLFTGVTLAIGVSTWLSSPLKFQADMGLLLGFLFLMNMVGALLLLPALGHFLFRPARTRAGAPAPALESTGASSR
jgi:predicted RND superfamily exporter protein